MSRALRRHCGEHTQRVAETGESDWAAAARHEGIPGLAREIASCKRGIGKVARRVKIPSSDGDETRPGTCSNASPAKEVSELHCRRL